MGMDQYLLIPFLVGWTSINPSYFDVNYRGTIGFDTAKWGFLMRTSPINGGSPQRSGLDLDAFRSLESNDFQAVALTLL